MATRWTCEGHGYACSESMRRNASRRAASAVNAGPAANGQPARSTIASAIGLFVAKSVTARRELSRYAGRVRWSSTSGWCSKAGHSPTVSTLVRTWTRKIVRVQRNGACGEASSYRPGIGVEASGSRASNGVPRKVVAGVASREISARAESASTTSRAVGSTRRSASTPGRARGGSATRRRQGAQDGGGQESSPADDSLHQR